MKIKTESDFAPVTISITFESKDELLDYWHRLNVPPTAVRNTAEESGIPIPKCLCREDLLWIQIDNLLKPL